MRLVAGLGAGIFVYLALGVFVGITPERLHRKKAPRRGDARWQEWLNQAGVPVSPMQFVAVSMLSGIVMAGIVLAVTRVPSLAVVAGGVTMASPRALFARRRRDRQRARLDAWPDALRDVITHLRASMSVHASLVELGRSGPLPLRPYFARYTGLASALDQQSALEVIREDLADPLSDRIIEVLLLAFDQGATVVVDILSDLAEAASQDLRLVDDIDTAQLETRLEARGASLLPFAVLALLCITSPGYQEFYASPAGWVVVTFGGVMSIVGLLTISRLGQIPTEQRILAGNSA